MSDTSPVLSLPYIQPSQAQKHVTHNEAIETLDVLVQATVLTRGSAAPPAAPDAGERHIVGPDATGDWAGHSFAIALYQGAAQGWRFFAPLPGWRVYVTGAGNEVVWTGAAWTVLSDQTPSFAQLGVSTAANETNRLAVASPAALFTHAGSDHRIKVNKAAATDTASLLFQTNWSGRAEMGTTGGDDFAIRVSADGTSFVTGLSVARQTGVVALPQGAAIDGALTGGAVQASQTDAAAGRILKVGAFGLGASAPNIGDASATDGSIAPGFWGYDTGLGSAGGPAGVTRGCLIHIRRATGAGEAQTLHVIAGTTAGAYLGAVFQRARADGAWGGWRAIGGGETATNALGRYRREQDGRQTCWQSVATLTTGDVAVTFPAAFAATAGLTVSLAAEAASGPVVACFHSRTATGLSLSAYDAAGARVAATVDLVSEGMWF